MVLNKGDIFLDVASWQPEDLTSILNAVGTRKTFIKLTEGTSYLNPKAKGQSNTSDVQGYYHFARFGGNAELAKQEANYFINNVKNYKSARYAVLDYESDASSDKNANTTACIAFMDILKNNGFSPIIYSYNPYFNANLSLDQITSKYPNSVWIAAYATAGRIDSPDYNWLPKVNHSRFWQFTQNYKGYNVDGNVVLMNDYIEDNNFNSSLIEDNKNMMFTFNIKDDINWKEIDIYLYNGNTNEVVKVNNMEELKWLRIVYKEVMNKDLRHYTWSSKAPVYTRFFGVTRPKINK